MSLGALAIERRDADALVGTGEARLLLGRLCVTGAMLLSLSPISKTWRLLWCCGRGFCASCLAACASLVRRLYVAPKQNLEVIKVLWEGVLCQLLGRLHITGAMSPIYNMYACDGSSWRSKGKR